ncbi:hypothetical protein AAFF_G00151340 [Aldrovandia affinis]|uniref:Uncharacterized protein n=1 Tax=Aldrovandia affinis TaxID=143900 RepID=A0AAD7W8U3_9TELE|nr:hypothetical protein AAFF_G00151340 [Aldrovandia affinis]
MGSVATGNCPVVIKSSEYKAGAEAFPCCRRPAASTALETMRRVGSNHTLRRGNCAFGFSACPLWRIVTLNPSSQTTRPDGGHRCVLCCGRRASPVIEVRLSLVPRCPLCAFKAPAAGARRVQDTGTVARQS